MTPQDATTTAPGIPPAAAAILEPSPMAQLRRRVFGHYGILIGGAVLGIIFLVAIFAPYLTPYHPILDQDLANALKPPFWHDSPKYDPAYPLGTDLQGRDYLTRLIHGSRISLLIGFSAMLISGVIGTTLGVAAGYFGGRVDMVVNFLITTRLSMPVVLVALAVVSLVGSSLWIVIWVLGLLIWDRFAVVMRSTTMQVRNLDYVAAAQACGCSTLRIVMSEILPNVANHLIVVATLEMAHAILLEAALSFLGLGVQPPAPSWGLMISEAKGMMFFDAWLIGVPGTALFALILSINLLGDGVRDVTAPENRN
ncbi:MAG: peptide ABC transporter permease [Rhodospirillales bacterium CG15_BIG_FIL_POST_REV_8_21_14_020_66_15]|nr:MAG: peptide ABC transporter permease [Rhodospirillales bacterium CG15_BIG_FIL_POST_REV_8_21_14_020_66_15]